MLFNNIFKIFICCFLVAACSDESIPRHQEKIIEDPSAEVKEDIVLKEFSQFSEKHNKVKELIDSKDSDKINTALMQVEEELFSPKAQDPNIYTSKNYVGYINLYTKIFVYWKANKSQEPLNSNFLKSIDSFKAQFVSNCINKDISNCKKLKDSLTQNKSTIVIINYLIEN